MEYMCTYEYLAYERTNEQMLVKEMNGLPQAIRFFFLSSNQCWMQWNNNHVSSVSTAPYLHFLEDEIVILLHIQVGFDVR